MIDEHKKRFENLNWLIKKCVCVTIPNCGHASRFHYLVEKLEMKNAFSSLDCADALFADVQGQWEAVRAETQEDATSAALLPTHEEPLAGSSFITLQRSNLNPIAVHEKKFFNLSVQLAIKAHSLSLIDRADCEATHYASSWCLVLHLGSLKKAQVQAFFAQIGVVL